MAPLLEGQRALTGEETSGVSLLVEHFSCATIVPRLSRERCRRVACIKIGDCGPSSLDKSMDKDGKWNLWKWYMSSIWLLLFAALQKSIHVHGLKVSLDKSLYIFICGIFIIEYIYNNTENTLREFGGNSSYIFEYSEILDNDYKKFS